MSKSFTPLLALLLCACPLDSTDDSGQTAGDDTASTTGDQETEPNDEKATAQSVTLPATIEAAIDPSQDIDWYSFDATTSITVSISEPDSNLELYIDVFAPSDNNIASWDTGARGAAFSDTVTVTDPGTHLVKIESAYADDTGVYTVTFE